MLRVPKLNYHQYENPPLFLAWAARNQSTASYCISLRSIFTFSDLCLRLPSHLSITLPHHNSAWMYHVPLAWDMSQPSPPPWFIHKNCQWVGMTVLCLFKSCVFLEYVWVCLTDLIILEKESMRMWEQNKIPQLWPKARHLNMWYIF
jgi:hypothetical protein